MPAPIKHENSNSSKTTDSQTRDVNSGDRGGSSSAILIVLLVVGFFLGFLLLARNKIKKRLEQQKKSEPEKTLETNQEIIDNTTQETVQGQEKSELEAKFDKLDSIVED